MLGQPVHIDGRRDLAADMGVRVDQAGHAGLAGQLDHSGAVLADEVGGGLLDLVAFDDHAGFTQ